MPIDITSGKKLSETRQVTKYVIADAIASILSYTGLYSYRKIYIEPEYFLSESVLKFDRTYFFAILLLPLFWVFLHLMLGLYKDIYRRSRLREFFLVFNASIWGSILVFFLFILDDYVYSYTLYYVLFFLYFGLQFSFGALFRYFLSSQTSKAIQSRKIGFPTLMIGSNQNAVNLYTRLQSKRKINGNFFVGFVSVNNNIKYLIEKNLAFLGNYTEMENVINENKIEEVVIAVESSEHHMVQSILSRLDLLPVHIKLIPDTYDILAGKVKMESVSEPMVEIPTDPMPYGQKIIKRIVDVVFSILILILISPLLLFVSIMVKLSSPGPIFFFQERIGLHGKPFFIIKFRSMFCDAEKEGPMLSSNEDPRITKWGKIMRKFRLDELPQFWNVLKGEMAIVGPRPERAYFAKQIIEQAPYYRQLYRIKPGITSWGMVKFGYAENVEEMIERLKFDLIYLENMNLLNDLKILIYTVLIVFQGRGK
ncbi:MAG: sugar transferase [Cryomorphaceae bacterium]|nr:sugar transferase [Cryomorphaceae bacterium]